MMKLEYDKAVDAAYLSVERRIKKGEVKKTVEVNKDIFIDLNNKGKLLGIEILNASKVLNKKVLLGAQQ
jgi:uncharacterized protein YuzE